MRAAARSLGLRTPDHFMGESGAQAYWSRERVLEHLAALPAAAQQTRQKVLDAIAVARRDGIDVRVAAKREKVPLDAVTFWAVMEHLVHPKLFLAKAASILKPGGHCFILVPNLRSLAVRLAGLKYRYIMPDHVNYFSASTLKNVAATEPAFEIVAQGSSHFNPLVLAQDFRGGEQRVPDEARARLLKRTTAYKQNPWLKPVKMLYSGAEKVLAMMNLADNLYVVLRKVSP